MAYLDVQGGPAEGEIGHRWAWRNWLKSSASDDEPAQPPGPHGHLPGDVGTDDEWNGNGGDEPQGCNALSRLFGWLGLR